MKKIINVVVGLFFLAQAISVLTSESEAGTTIKQGVVYHVSSRQQAIPTLRHIKNQSAVMPHLEVTVVAVAEGIDFLLDGEKDIHGNDYAATIDQLLLKGVQFKACGNTLDAKNLTPDDLTFGIEVVPAGIAEILRLQIEEGYAYIKP